MRERTTENKAKRMFSGNDALNDKKEAIFGCPSAAALLHQKERSRA
jgi:hypothetical protein